MTYAEYLQECRKLAASNPEIPATSKTNGEISKSEFARLCGDGVSEAYYINIENGVARPGRELLEKAALLAGFDFEQNLSLPKLATLDFESQRALSTFRSALIDKRRRRAAILLAESLRKPEKKAKHKAPMRKAGKAGSG